MLDQTERDVDLGRFGVELVRLRRGGTRFREGIERRDATVEAEDAVRVGETSVGRGVSGVSGNRALELGDGLVRNTPVEKVLPLQVVVVSLKKYFPFR